MKWVYSLLIIILLLPVPLESKSKRLKNDSPADDFIEKTRLIMLKDEIRLYKNLPDEEAREVFIEDFWKKRDPTPETDENENKIEYERRLEYVERWFKEGGGTGKGWNADRGRIYLLIGDPDERSVQQRYMLDSFGREKRVLTEIWIYQYYNLYLEFVDEQEFGVYRLRNWSVELMSAIEDAKFIINRDKKSGQVIKFKSRIEKEKNLLIIQVPVKYISFRNTPDEKMEATFSVTIYVYKDYKKIDRIDKTQTVTQPKEALLNQKNIEFSIPLNPYPGGKYIFDITVKDAIDGSAYREIIGHKY